MKWRRSNIYFDVSLGFNYRTTLSARIYSAVEIQHACKKCIPVCQENNVYSYLFFDSELSSISAAKIQQQKLRKLTKEDLSLMLLIVVKLFNS